MSLAKKLFNSVKGAMDISGVVVDVVLIIVLIPVIKTQIAGAQNLTTTETTVLGLVTLFIVLALIINVGRQSGLIGKKK